MTLRRADAVEASARCAHRRFADECRFGYFTEASLRFLHDFGATPDKARLGGQFKKPLDTPEDIQETARATEFRECIRECRNVVRSGCAGDENYGARSVRVRPLNAARSARRDAACCDG
ncbi:hypothetical protein [Burkholderia pseudomallei]|nr:hypothetical protein X948_3825 [Burkholderia pseudomallei MSHR5608]KGS24408.1 hypothetical protein X962_4945 [Burkholderia pseudomallei MSHR7343]MBM5577179.1 hypothetical protein [Burkholderia pseudomallei]MBO2951078.1 hypothetical protein [Burkholderia pseudomallei]MBO2984559.1 hypothetical protein [Burkholderia pseudomallei]